MERTVAQYSYVLDAGVEWAGQLRAVTWPEYSQPRSMNYAYYDGGTNAFIASQSGYIQTYQLMPPDFVTAVAVDTGGNQDLSISYEGDNNPQYSCTQARSARRVLNDRFSQPGDSATWIDWRSHLNGIDASWAYVGHRISQQWDLCDGGSCAGMSQGNKQWEYACNAGDRSVGQPHFGYLTAVKDKRENWNYYGYQRPDAGFVAQADVDAGLYLLPEETAEKLGATSMIGENPLQTKAFSYVYGGVGQTPRAYEQLREVTERDSVAAPTGTPNAKARTKNVYDLGTNRLKATIKSGWTERLDMTTQTWVTEQKYSGTFYFTSHVCTGESTPDPLGRTLEVHGPCWVTGEDATDCPAGAPAPVTQYFFWPNSETSSRRNRLQRMSRFPTNGGPTLCSGYAHLDTTYNQYDIRGNPTEVVDENGVTTLHAYEGDTLKTTTTAGLTTNFTYDNGKLTAIQYPQGNYEVLCYRTNSVGGCSGAWTPFLQWRAKADSADGSVYSEKIAYTYWPDGTIATETFISYPAQIRRVRKYAADVHRRPTFEQWGDSSGQFTAAKGFDGADNLARIGLPYNTPPSWCINSMGQASTQCSQLTYDRANRLAIVDEYPRQDSNPGIRTCIDHDAHGNVVKVSPGCQTSQMCAGLDGGTSSCTTAASGYKYDDFGNLVEATLPWLDNGTGNLGTIHHEYDAQGNALRKQTPAMVANGEWLAYSYDLLGRILLAAHHRTLPSPGSENLYQLAYDSSQTISGSCSDPILPANTNGRLLLRTDSFGQTWYRYDFWGRVVMEIRLRDGTCTGTVTNNPHTAYTYTPNGNLASVTYPLGRTVTYVYGSGANSDRPQEVDVAMSNGGTSWTTSAVITGVIWEPYGGLRGYQINSSGNSGAVEYFLGDNAASPGCPVAPPSSNDHTGRLRALRVSTGPFTPGTSVGDIYKRTYIWQADQVSQIDTCLLGSATPRTETYGYDQLLRLLNASGTAGVGSFVTRTYSYDSRGNRSGQAVEDCPWSLSYASSAHPDQLTRSSSGCVNATLKHDYAFDFDGRVATKNWPVDSSGSPAYSLTLQSGPSGSGAIDSVFKAVVVNGAAYNYFYDAFARRRFKSYPLDGVNDEYFHSARNELLSDRGVSSIAPNVGGYPADDYVWLDGRPVAVVRGKFDGTWARLPDSTPNCMRNDEPAACGLYFIVTDHLGKAVLLLDSSQKVAGTLDYEPFGLVNRVALDRETPHPYPNKYNANIADFTQPVGGPLLSLKMRVLFHMVDVEDGPGDYAKLRDGDTLQDFPIPPIGGYHRGQMWSPWVQPQAGHIVIPFVSDGQNCCPDGMGGVLCTPNLCPSYPNYPYQGIVMEGYEYQRYQIGAASFGIPLRFPGQYFDAESDLFENWNRFYDPTIGRYLQHDPKLSIASWMRRRTDREVPLTPTLPDFDPQPPMQYDSLPENLRPEHRFLSSGLSPYCYGENNPLYFVDPTGRDGQGPGTVTDECHDYIGTAPSCLSGQAILWECIVYTCRDVSGYGLQRRGTGCDNGTVKTYFEKCVPLKGCAKKFQI